MKISCRSKEEVDILWMMLDLEFMAMKPASYEEVADQVLNLVLWKERIRNGMEKTETDRLISDEATLKRMRSLDSDDPELLSLEKVFKRLANGQSGDAMRLLERSIENRHEKIRKRQQEIAKKPRSARHPLSTMVEPIVRSNPGITENQLFHELRKAMTTMANPQCTFSADSFKPSDKKHPAVPRKNLRQYLYRAKKKLSR